MVHKSFADCISGVVAGGMRMVYLEKQSTKTIRNSWRWSGGSGPTMSVESVSQGPWD